MIHAYQVYAGRFDTKTLDAHLASIRDFEGFCEGRAFGSVTEKVAGAYRNDLIARGEAELGRSTIRHRASHLRAFFAWLVQQDGYRRMNRTIGDYFLLPKRLSAKTLQPAPRPFPTSDEVHQLLTGMPAQTLIERRDRAIVAASFLFGTRASATASLRLGCVDVERQKVYQDATVVRVKNGKSQTTTWFPNVDPANEIVRAWIEELVELGCGPNDALFPPDAALASPKHLKKPGRAPIEPWKADRGIGRAFSVGCKASDLPDFNPHSARHYLKWLGDRCCRSRIERRAWSHNMGHETEQITELNYAKMTDDQRDEIFARLTARDDATEDDKDLLIALYEYRLTPGTPEFERARRLANARQRRLVEKSG
ncbi:MAG TPA: tyrosine-type recombinase/integrase [Devosiaceae bacterium]